MCVCVSVCTRCYLSDTEESLFEVSVVVLFSFELEEDDCVPADELPRLCLVLGLPPLE